MVRAAIGTAGGDSGLGACAARVSRRRTSPTRARGRVAACRGGRRIPMTGTRGGSSAGMRMAHVCRSGLLLALVGAHAAAAAPPRRRSPTPRGAPTGPRCARCSRRRGRRRPRGRRFHRAPLGELPRHREIAELLIGAGSRVDAANDLGVTPLWARANGSPAMAGALLAAGPDPNRALPVGETPLMTASRAATSTRGPGCSRPGPRSTRPPRKAPTESRPPSCGRSRRGTPRWWRCCWSTAPTSARGRPRSPRPSRPSRRTRTTAWSACRGRSATSPRSRAAGSRRCCSRPAWAISPRPGC